MISVNWNSIPSCIFSPKLGTFRSPEGEYFVEPLHSYNGVHYEEEHNKPHIVYRKDTPEKDGRDEEACETSGKIKPHFNDDFSLPENNTLTNEV